MAGNIREAMRISFGFNAKHPGNTINNGRNLSAGECPIWIIFVVSDPIDDAESICFKNRLVIRVRKGTYIGLYTFLIHDVRDSKSLKSAPLQIR